MQIGWNRNWGTLSAPQHLVLMLGPVALEVGGDERDDRLALFLCHFIPAMQVIAVQHAPRTTEHRADVPVGGVTFVQIRRTIRHGGKMLHRAESLLDASDDWNLRESGGIGEG
ncbi:hypothetical protein ASF71_16505 [Deinococcus sp. Leaf326]|nr:hypothetical protein ASF71_16505 [Deinococcus sp. Leaf326]